MLCYFQVYSSDSVIYPYLYLYLHLHLYILFQILFPYRLLQNIEYSSLCYTVGPCWLSILYIVVWGFPGGAVVKNPPANEGDMRSSPGPGRSYIHRSN